MRSLDPPTATAEPMTLVLQAVKEATRGACHLADVAGRCAPPRASATAEAAIQASLEAGLRASRALFTLEDALQATVGGRGPVREALASLHAAEEALQAARLAIEAQVSRTLQPAPRPGGGAAPRP